VLRLRQLGGDAAAVEDDGRLARQAGSHLLDQQGGVDRSAPVADRRSGPRPQHLLERLAHLLEGDGPGRVGLGASEFRESQPELPQDHLHVSGKADIGAPVAADLLGFDVDLDDLEVGPEERRPPVAQGPVVAGAEDEGQVGPRQPARDAKAGGVYELKVSCLYETEAGLAIYRDDLLVGYAQPFNYPGEIGSRVTLVAEDTGVYRFEV